MSEFLLMDVKGSLIAILLAALFTVLGIWIKGWLSNSGNIAVAKINAHVSLGEQAMQVMTAAMEALKDENHNLKNTISQMNSQMERIIEYILMMMKAETQSEADDAVRRLEQYLKSIGRWAY
jgi:cell division protein FtsB